MEKIFPNFDNSRKIKKKQNHIDTWTNTEFD